jgi:hypothetical protein
VPTDIHRGRIDHVLDMRRVKFLDHLNTGTAVFGELVDVGPFHEPHRYIGVSEAIGRPGITFPVRFQILFVEDSVQ